MLKIRHFEFQKLCASLLMLLLLATPSSASFVYEMEIKDKASISKMNDQTLIEMYINVLIELEAAKTYHDVAGFSKPSEYKNHKDLIRYRVNLMMEIKKRELSVPNINP